MFDKINANSLFGKFLSALDERSQLNLLQPPQQNRTATLTGNQAAINNVTQRFVEAQQDDKKAQNDGLKKMYDGVTGASDLNKKLLETITAVDPQPTGIKPKKKQLGGVSASESAASRHSKLMVNNDLKAKFERLGDKYGVPPALIAGIASRESNMGSALKQSGVYTGWGDFGQRKGEKVSSYHGFGIIQVDRVTAPLGINKELQTAFGKTQLDPYSEEHIEWGVKSFLKKLEEAKANNPKDSEAEQIATAISKYNGGIKDATYPKNDAGTSGKDYANDTLARARWFANNWDKIK